MIVVRVIYSTICMIMHPMNNCHTLCKFQHNQGYGTSAPKQCSYWTTHRILLFAACIVNTSANQFSKCQQSPDLDHVGILLDCQYKGITHIPKNVPHKNVTTLYMQYNKISSIRSGDLDNVTELVMLFLHLKQIRHISDNAFVGLSNYLDLHSNILGGWPRKPVVPLVNLRGLDIRNVIFSNNITTPFLKEFNAYLTHIKFALIGEGDSSLHISKTFFDTIVTFRGIQVPREHFIHYYPPCTSGPQ